MDSRSHKEKRRTAKIPTRQRRREDSSSKTKKSGTFKEHENKKESSSSRNTKENALNVKKLFEPVKNQLQLVLEYLNIMDMRTDLDVVQQITIFLEFFDTVRRQCEIYLNCQIMKGSRNG